MIYSYKHDNDKEVIKEHFDHHSSTWHNRLNHHPYSIRFEAVRRLLSNHQFHSVLDIGCGTGDYCTLFDTSQTKYLGVDISKDMIEECRNLYPNCNFRVGDCENLDLRDQSVDLVLCVGVIEYYNNNEAIFNKISRVTASGGSIIVTGPNGSNKSLSLNEPLNRIARNIKRLFVKDKTRNATDNESEEQFNKGVIHRRFTEEELKTIGNHYGMTLTDTRYVSLYIVPAVFPWVHSVNYAISKILSARKGCGWFTKYVATSLVCHFVKA